MDTVAKLLQGTSKPKKARRMSQMVVDPNSGHRVLEIAGPIGDKEEHKVTEQDFNLSRVDIDPATLEGDIYHAKFSVSMLLKRVKAQEQKNILTEVGEFLNLFYSVHFTSRLSTY